MSAVSLARETRVGEVLGKRRLGTLRLAEAIGVRSAPPTVADPRLPLLEEFLTHRQRLNMSPLSCADWRRAVRKLFATYPTAALPMFTAEHIERHLWDRHLSALTTRTMVMRLRSFFTFLIKRGVIDRNPCDGVELPKCTPRLRPAPSRPEVEAVRAACRTIIDRLLVDVLYFTGVRISELRSVLVRDIDLTTRRVRIMGKGHRERWVVFPPEVGRTIRDYLRAEDLTDPATPLLTSRYASSQFRGTWTTHRINQRLRGLGKAVRLPYRLTAHILRHGFFRMCKEKGIPVDVAAKLGGNSPAMVLNIYGQFQIDDMQALYDERIHPTQAIQRETEQLDMDRCVIEAAARQAQAQGISVREFIQRRILG